MAAYAHGGGFSVDAGVRIEASDRAGLERLLRYCAQPPFVMDRLKQYGADLAYRCEVFPLICSMCGGQMRSIVFITFSVHQSSLRLIVVMAA